MLYTYQECIEKYGSDYQMRKVIEKGELFKLEKGIYSDIQYATEEEILAKKYPEAILTMDSAFYHYGLTDTIPDYSHLATDRDASKMKDERVKQCFLPKEVVELGVVKEKQIGYEIKIYSKERMLIEVVRNKSKLPYDYYKEIIGRYRKLVNELDIQEVQEMAAAFPKSNKIMERLESEVF